MSGFLRMRIKEAIDFHHSDDAPEAIGPYSQAVSVGGLVYTSGQVALDPKTNRLVSTEFEPQARQVFANLKAVLASAGCRFDDVLKATVFLKDFKDFDVLNRIYAEHMGSHRPARSTVQVAALPKGALLEIDFIARLA